jgi:DNA-binding response OmpR family regulator
MKPNLLIFGTKNFNNSLDEIKEDLGFSFIYFDPHNFNENLLSSVSALLLDSRTCEDKMVSEALSKITKKPILFLDHHISLVKCKYDEKITLPINFSELGSKITNLITAYKFNNNSSILIKNYILDKNEKKFKNKKNLFIIITEREVQLIELLFNEKIPLPKKVILQKIWKYSKDADTHTVETHIYRLRKKISDKFKDENFIINTKAGYSL